MSVHRIENAVLLQGRTLVEVRWVLDRGARDVWRTDSVPPSSAITHVLKELERAIALVRTAPERELLTRRVAALREG